MVFHLSRDDDMPDELDTFELDQVVDKPDPKLAKPEPPDTLVSVRVAAPALTRKRGYYVAIDESGKSPTAYLVPIEKADLVAGNQKVPRAILDASPLAKDFGPAIASALPAVEDLCLLFYLNGIVDDKTLTQQDVQRALNLWNISSGDVIKNV